MRACIPVLAYLCAALSLNPLLVRAEAEDEVIARIGAEKITLKEFSKVYPSIVSWFGLGAKADQVQGYLDKMVLNRLAAREARQAGFEKDPSLAYQIDTLLATAYLRKALNDANIEASEEDLKQYYQEHRDEYRLPQKMELSHIFVLSEEEAKDIRRKLESSPFESMARQLSVDPMTSRRGGSFGMLETRALNPELAEAAVKLREGQISDVIRTSFGYHILRMTRFPAAEYRPFDDVKQEIYSGVMEAKRLEIINGIKDDLWRKYRVSFQHAELAKAVNAPSKIPNLTKAPIEPMKGPRLAALVSEIQLGAIGPKPAMAAVLIVNSGQGELDIKQVSSNCDCIKAAIAPRKIKPGEIAKLTLNIDTQAAEKGPFKKAIYLNSNDGEKPQRALYVHAEIRG